MWSAWRYGGIDPYRLHHNLDGRYAPLGDGGEPRPPLYPDRLKAVVCAFARYSHIVEIQLHGGKVTKTKKPKPKAVP